jgi:hypothetical protein
MKYKLYGAILVALVSGAATLVLRTHVPIPAAKTAEGGNVKGDSIRSRSNMTNRSHFTAANSGRATQTLLLNTYGKLPLSFEANHGQTDSQVQFLSRGHGYTVFLASTEAVLVLQGSEGRPRSTSPKPRIAQKFQAHHSLSSAAALKLGIPPLRDSPAQLRHGGASGLVQSELPSSPEPKASTVLRMKLVGANDSPRVAGLEQLPGRSNYFLGKDPKRWRTNVPTYAKVKYDSVYPGVDLVYYGNQGQLEYDFVVAPGANPRDIGLSIQGANRVNVDSQGDLVVDMGSEVVRLHKPIIYQSENSSSEIKNQKLKIDGNFVLHGKNQVGFQVAEYDTSKPLVIDPVLKYSTYLGGSGDDFGGFLDSVAVDPRGNAYIIGQTNSIDFPTTTGALQTTFAGIGDVFFTGDAFVAKLNAAGTALVYSTYLGGTADELGKSIAVDPAGNAYLAGDTFSTDFPTMNPIQAANGGGFDSFLAKLNPAGDALVYSTYLGGSDWDIDPMIDIDPSGNLYAQGFTFSTDFPTTTGAFQATCASCSNGLPDTYVAKLNAAGNALVYSTYLGGSGEDVCGLQIAVDPTGNVYVIGITNSTDFPTTPGAFQTSLVPGSDTHDSFLTKLNRDGTGLVYSTYLGGSDFDFIFGTAVDAVGNAYVTGFTFSNDFPTMNPIQPAYAGGGDAFMAKLNRDGTALVYSTYLGGTDFEQGAGMAVDPAGNAYAVGTTYSTDFPTLNPIQGANAGLGDAFVTQLNASGNALAFSTYLGGSGDDEAGAIVLDSRGNVYIDGLTTSTDFPLLNALQPAFGGGYSDAFVAKIGPGKQVLLTSTGQPGSAPAQSLASSRPGKARTNGAVQDWKRTILKRRAAH